MPKTSDRDRRGAESGFIERLTEVVGKAGGAGALGEKIHRSDGLIRKWLRGETEPDLTDILNICDATGTSVVWLCVGPSSGLDRAVGSVAEQPGSYEVDETDVALLRVIGESLDQFETEQGKKLTPGNKARLGASLYRFFVGAPTAVDKESVLHMLRTVAALS